ncbi:MAG: T9SS type A sorting domain-containing protein, partial [Bacteroidota bacterium]|nr:T9SS type A sorting domain-containing protein [Bacteroidota bacterium]
AIGMPMVVPNAFETTNHQHLSIALYDMLGKKVSAAADTFTKGENIYSINVSHLPKGLYIILVGDVMQKVVVD